MNKIIAIGGLEIFSYGELGTVFGKVLNKEVKPIRLSPEQFKKEYFNSDVILFRAQSDSILTKKEVDTIESTYPGITLKKLEDYLNNPNDPMLKAFFK